MIFSNNQQSCHIPSERKIFREQELTPSNSGFVSCGMFFKGTLLNINTGTTFCYQQQAIFLAT